MIEEVAIVSQVNDYQVSVQTTQSSSCGKCMQKDSCATSLLDKFIAKRDIVVDTDLYLQSGDKVLVGINESAFIKGSILLYIMPLIALLIGAMCGESLALSFAGYSADFVSALFALVFFIVSLLIIHTIQRSWLLQYFARPVVIRKL